MGGAGVARHACCESLYCLALLHLEHSKLSRKNCSKVSLTCIRTWPRVVGSVKDAISSSLERSSSPNSSANALTNKTSVRQERVAIQVPL